MSGGRRFSLRRQMALIEHIVHARPRHLTRLKLRSLLYLIDLEAYLRRGKSLTGAQYRRGKRSVIVQGLSRSLRRLTRGGQNPMNWLHPKHKEEQPPDPLAQIKADLAKYPPSGRYARTPYSKGELVMLIRALVAELNATPVAVPMQRTWRQHTPDGVEVQLMIQIRKDLYLL